MYMEKMIKRKLPLFQNIVPNDRRMACIYSINFIHKFIMNITMVDTVYVFLQILSGENICRSQFCGYYFHPFLSTAKYNYSISIKWTLQLQILIVVNAHKLTPYLVNLTLQKTQGYGFLQH